MTFPFEIFTIAIFNHFLGCTNVPKSQMSHLTILGRLGQWCLALALPNAELARDHRCAAGSLQQILGWCRKDQAPVRLDPYVPVIGLWLTHVKPSESILQNNLFHFSGEEMMDFSAFPSPGPPLVPQWPWQPRALGTGQGDSGAERCGSMRLTSGFNLVVLVTHWWRS